MRDVIAEFNELRLLGMASAWADLLAQDANTATQSGWLKGAPHRHPTQCVPSYVPSSPVGRIYQVADVVSAQQRGNATHGKSMG